MRKGGIILFRLSRSVRQSAIGDCPTGHTATLAYDSRGLLTSTTAAQNHITKFTYDALGPAADDDGPAESHDDAEGARGRKGVGTGGDLRSRRMRLTCLMR